MTSAEVEASWSSERRIDLRRLLGVYRRGGGDPTYWIEPVAMRSAAGSGEAGSAETVAPAIWRAVDTPTGPATLRFSVAAPAGPSTTVGVKGAVKATVTAQGWGPGAPDLLAGLAGWVGARDDVSTFQPQHPLLAELHHQNPDLRLGRSGLIWDALLPAILEQKVTGGEAQASFAWLVRKYAMAAPGPLPLGRRSPLLVPPGPAVLVRIPSWDWHRAGVGPQRSQTVVLAARAGQRLAESASMSGPEAEAVLRSIPGIGRWTAAEVRQRALGDADAVSVGDFHVPRLIIFALTGEVSDSDERMLEVLQPYAGHRFRVQRLLESSSVKSPRFGPRYSPHNFKQM